MKEYNKEMDLVIYRWKEGPSVDLAKARLRLIHEVYGEDNGGKEERDNRRGCRNRTE